MALYSSDVELCERCFNLTVNVGLHNGRFVGVTAFEFLQHLYIAEN